MQVSRACRECLSSMLEKDPGKRFSAQQASRHAWLAGERRKRALPLPIPREVRESAALEAEAAAACAASPAVEMERQQALLQAYTDWEETLSSDSDSG